MRESSPALIAGDLTLSHAALEQEVLIATRRLRALGVRDGDRVALRAANCPRWVMLARAIPRAGGTLVPLSTRLTEREIEDAIARTKARLLLTDAPHAARAAGGLQVISLDLLDEVAPSSDRPDSDTRLDPGREHTILFTSGTSGRPKGAILTWGNHVASARAAAAILPLGSGDRWLASLPFYHIGGLNILYRCALQGACVVLPDSLAPEDLSRAIEAHAITHASFVDTLLRRLLAERGGRPFPAALRAIVVGGGPVSRETIESCPQALASYGLTESCSMATMVRPGAPMRQRLTAGHPLPGIDLRIDPHGRIEIRGEVVMQGYLDDPEGTRESLRDGWLRTWDIGEVDHEGCLRVHARREDLIISGGENVYPAEIEEALRSHPRVVDAVVIGVQDADWGESPLAIVVLESGDTAELTAFLKARLAGFKIPRITVTDRIPLLENGKPDRAAIRARYGSPTTPPA